MTPSPTATTVTALVDLPLFPYLDALGAIPAALEGKIGVYAIFDQQQTLQLVAFSRNVFQSLKQHLVRCPERCYWLKVKTVERPSRTVLNEIQSAWIIENGVTPPGNGVDTALWQDAIDIKPMMTTEELATYTTSDEREQTKLLKRVARRVEAGILDRLQARGVSMDIRFNPKQKELGLLDLK
ncbi:MAG: GIY-YIG nuclease family protein [Spirulina sp. SIO3F2]|nr:GIY-YIG nuclease family protein [Spirulina sp. SIO3F2]